MASRAHAHIRQNGSRADGKLDGWIWPECTVHTYRGIARGPASGARRAARSYMQLHACRRRHVGGATWVARCILLKKTCRNCSFFDVHRRSVTCSFAAPVELQNSVYEHNS
jgi:hypothetical protein